MTSAVQYIYDRGGEVSLSDDDDSDEYSLLYDSASEVLADTEDADCLCCDQTEPDLEVFNQQRGIDLKLCTVVDNDGTTQNKTQHTILHVLHT